MKAAIERTQRERKLVWLMAAVNILLLPLIFLGTAWTMMLALSPGARSGTDFDILMVVFVFSPALFITGNLGFFQNFRSGTMRSLKRHTFVSLLCPLLMILTVLGTSIAGKTEKDPDEPVYTPYGKRLASGDRSERPREHFYGKRE